MVAALAKEQERMEVSLLQQQHSAHVTESGELPDPQLEIAGAEGVDGDYTQRSDAL